MGNLLEPFDLMVPRGEAVGYLKMAAESIVPGVMHLLQGAELSVWGQRLQFNLVDQKHRSNQYSSPEWRACRAVPEEQHKERLLHAQFVARCLMQPQSSSTEANANIYTERSMSKRKLAQSSSQEPLHKQTREKSEKVATIITNKLAIKSLKEMVIAIQQQINTIMDRLNEIEVDP